MKLRLDPREFRKIDADRLEDAVKEKFTILHEYGKIDYIIDTYICFYDAYEFAKNLFLEINSIVLFNTTIDDVEKIAYLLEKYKVINDWVR